MDEQKLLRLLRKDPNRGMEKLIEAYAGLVYAVIARVIGNPRDFTSEIEGCAADVFSEFYMNLEQYDPTQSSIKTWLCVIARNNAVDLLRKADKNRRCVSLDDGDMCIPIGADKTPEEALLEEELRRRVLMAVNDLGEPDRTIILRKFFYRQPSRQIAQDLGMTVSNVDTRTHRAIGKLKNMIGGAVE